MYLSTSRLFQSDLKGVSEMRARQSGGNTGRGRQSVSEIKADREKIVRQENSQEQYKTKAGVFVYRSVSK